MLPAERSSMKEYIYLYIYIYIYISRETCGTAVVRYSCVMPGSVTPANASANESVDEVVAFELTMVE